MNDTLKFAKYWAINHFKQSIHGLFPQLLSKWSPNIWASCEVFWTQWLCWVTLVVRRRMLYKIPRVNWRKNQWVKNRIYRLGGYLRKEKSNKNSLTHNRMKTSFVYCITGMISTLNKCNQSCNMLQWAFFSLPSDSTNEDIQNQDFPNIQDAFYFLSLNDLYKCKH